MSDKTITEILGRYGEPMQGNVWRVQGQGVIYHKALERIAAKAGISFDEPSVIRSEEKEAVILVRGNLEERREWSIGEANMNLNYRTSGKQQAYPYAMAEKRGKDRVILKLIGLHGLLYSEEEADEFKNSRPAEEPPQAAGWDPEPSEASQPSPDTKSRLKLWIDEAMSINGVTDLMLDARTVQDLNSLADADRNEVRDYAKRRLVALGWPKK